MIYKFLVKLFRLQPLTITEPQPIEMPIEDEDKVFLDLVVQICLAQSDEELLVFFKKTRNSDLRYLISLRSKQLNETVSL